MNELNPRMTAVLLAIAALCFGVSLNARASETKPLTQEQHVRMVQSKIRRAVINLHRIDAVIREKESDLKVMTGLAPHDGSIETSAFSENIESTKSSLIRLKARRAELANAILYFSKIYGAPVSNPSRGYAGRY